MVQDEELMCLGWTGAQKRMKSRPRGWLISTWPYGGCFKHVTTYGLRASNFLGPWVIVRAKTLLVQLLFRYSLYGWLLSGIDRRQLVGALRSEDRALGTWGWRSRKYIFLYWNVQSFPEKMTQNRTLTEHYWANRNFKINAPNCISSLLGSRVPIWAKLSCEGMWSRKPSASEQRKGR